MALKKTYVAGQPRENCTRLMSVSGSRTSTIWDESTLGSHSGRVSGVDRTAFHEAIVQRGSSFSTGMSRDSRVISPRWSTLRCKATSELSTSARDFPFGKEVLRGDDLEGVPSRLGRLIRFQSDELDDATRELKRDCASFSAVVQESMSLQFVQNLVRRSRGACGGK